MVFLWQRFLPASNGGHVLNWLQSLAAKIAIGALMGATIFAGGFVSGRKSGQMEQLADTVEAFQKRGKIDAATGSKSSFELCTSLGGLPEQCAELRGMDEAPGAE